MHLQSIQVFNYSFPFYLNLLRHFITVSLLLAVYCGILLQLAFAVGIFQSPLQLCDLFTRRKFIKVREEVSERNNERHFQSSSALKFLRKESLLFCSLEEQASESLCASSFPRTTRLVVLFGQKLACSGATRGSATATGISGS